VWHIDLYRLKKEEELFELGVLEAMCDSICLIEWPYMLEKYIERYNFTELDLS
jgi:tRNA threonylcarbamoyladenosine biosynthesis protein TsaE